MFDEMTKKYVEAAVGSETQNAVENWGLTYNSLHEGYAVLKEEVEEAEERINELNHQIGWLWSCIKNGESKPDFKRTIEHTKHAAEQLALEACQVAAVCNKILNGLKNEEAGTDAEKTN